MDRQEYEAKVAWLRRYEKARAKEQRLYARLREARDGAVGISSALGGTHCQTRSGASGVERAVERIGHARSEWLDQLERIDSIYAETLRAILRIRDARQRRVLRLRYLGGMPMHRIAAEMGISLPTAKRLYRKGMAALDMTLLTSYN